MTGETARSLKDLFGTEVFRYTLKQAEEDGVLLSILPIWPRSLISHVTANLLSKGYLQRNGKGLWMANLVDLLNQAIHKMKEDSPDGIVKDMYGFNVEFPDGQQGRVFAQMNELGRLTLMLPEDY